MRFIALLLLTLVTTTSAYANTIQADITYCSTEETMTTYTKEKWIKHRNIDEVLSEINKNQVFCITGVVTFTEGKRISVLSEAGIDYSIVEITVDGAPKYAMYRSISNADT